MDFIKNYNLIGADIEVFISFLLGFFTTSFFYFYSEKKKRKRELKLYLALLKKDSWSFISKIQLIKNSVDMYNTGVDRLGKNEIGSIGFPMYSIKELSVEFPLTVLDYEVDDFTEKIDATNLNIVSFNGFLSGFYEDISDIQNQLKNKKIEKESGLAQYKYQQSFLKKYMQSINILEKNAVDVYIMISYFLRRTKYRSFKLSLYHLKTDFFEKFFYRKFHAKKYNEISLELNKIRENIISEGE